MISSVMDTLHLRCLAGSRVFSGEIIPYLCCHEVEPVSVTCQGIADYMDLFVF